MLKMEKRLLKEQDGKERELQDYLEEKQGEISARPNYEERVAEGKRLWENKSRKQFKLVREILGKMCVGPQRCNYCEDSAADETEHIHPKDLYPEFVFSWINYLFSCGPSI